MIYNTFKINTEWWLDDNMNSRIPLIDDYSKSQIKSENPTAWPFLIDANRHLITLNSQEASIDEPCVAHPDYIKFVRSYDNDILIDFYQNGLCINIQKVYCDLICKNKEQLVQLLNTTKDFCDWMYLDMHGNMVRSSTFKKYNRVPVTITVWKKLSDKELFFVEPTSIWSGVTLDHIYDPEICGKSLSDMCGDECYVLFLVTKEFGAYNPDFTVPSHSQNGLPIRITDKQCLTTYFWNKVINALKQSEPTIDKIRVS